MKTFNSLLVLTILLSGCFACTNKASDRTVVESKRANDTLQACGVVVDATMNGFTIVTPLDDTVFISTMNRDIALKGGLLLGDTLDVLYTTANGNEPDVNVALTVKKVH